MPNKKFLSLFVFLLLNVAWCSAQIVTSKKEAVKKGIYQKPSTASKEIAMVSEKLEPAEKPKAKPSKITKKPSKSKSIINDEEAHDIIIGVSDNYLATQMINNAMQFIGVRYRGGGVTTAGMDCSGMVTAVFSLFDMKLPRSSHEMATVGEKVATEEAQKGDLIFFRTNGRSISHVGIVTEVLDGEIKFIHSSTSLGVVISSTGEAYYKKTFVQLNRVL